VIAVLTHPRPGVSYLLDTLASIDESATGRRVVVCDSPAELPAVPAPWEVHRFERPATERPENRWALWRCFDLAHDRGEDLIVCEDDVAMCRNGARHAEWLPVPRDVHWISLYDPHFRPTAPHCLARMPGVTFVFAQIVKFPLRTCTLLRWMGCGRYDRMGSDDQLGAIGHALGLTYAIHVPSLAQHVGAVSAVGNGELAGRTSESFRREYDPTTEPRETFH
jgi:hypothetical protein